jgi:hypothetical protein
MLVNLLLTPCRLVRLLPAQNMLVDLLLAQNMLVNLLLTPSRLVKLLPAQNMLVDLLRS